MQPISSRPAILSLKKKGRGGERTYGLGWETCNVVLSFECVDEILWCDHLNEISGSTFVWFHFFFNILQNEIQDYS